MKTLIEPKRYLFAGAVLVLAFLCGGRSVFATDGTWNLNGNGNWATGGSWVGAIIPDGQDGTATFGSIILANRTVTCDTRTIGNLSFSNVFAYTISSGTLTLSTSVGTPTIHVGTNSATINSVVAGTQGLVKNGPGVIVFGGANTITGPFTLNAGTLRANAVGGFNGQTITQTADVTTCYHNAAGTYAGAYNIIGNGVSENDFGDTHLGAIRFAANGVILSGPITLNGDSGISARGATGAGATISGQITGNYRLRFGRTTTSVGGNNNGIITLSNTGNNWTGDTTIEEGTVRIGAAGVIPNGASAGNVILKNDGLSHTNNTSDTVLDLNGNEETINGLAHDPASDFTKLKVNSSTGTGTLVVGDNDATAVFGGILQNGAGTLALTKIGAGTQTLTNVNTYSGNTTINAGKLALTGGGSIANSSRIIISGGAILDVSGATFALSSSQTLSNSTSTGVINGNAGTGTRTISLTYASGTPSLTVTNGTLTLASGTVVKVNNTGGALAAGSYKIISKATVNNVGAVAGTAPSAVTVNGGGIAPGANASLAINGGELYLTVFSTPRFSKISVSGTTLTIAASNGLAGGPWALLQSTNLALPLSQWETNRTGVFDGGGNLITNLLNTVTNRREFYMLKQ